MHNIYWYLRIQEILNRPVDSDTPSLRGKVATTYIGITATDDGYIRDALERGQMKAADRAQTSQSDSYWSVNRKKLGFSSVGCGCL